MKKIFILPIFIVLICAVDYQYQQNWEGTCNSGKKQSPININTFKTDHNSNLKLNIYMHDSFITTNPLRNYLENQYTDSYFDFYRGTSKVRYTSQKYLFHSPSQHTINGKQANLQMQIVYKLNDGFTNQNKYSIVTILFKVSRNQNQNTIFTNSIFYRPSTLNLRRIFSKIIHIQNFFIYEGSSTIPSCTQNVTWFISQTVYSITLSQLRNIKSQLNHARPNNRHTQRLNDRKVEIIIRNPKINLLQQISKQTEETS